MSKRTPYWRLFVAVASVLAGLAIFAVVALAAGELSITGITPASINPSKGEYARITFKTTVTADVNVYVRNAAGTTVKSIVRYNDLAAGTRTLTWSGRDTYSRIVPDGKYTVVVEGRLNSGAVLTPATGTITVTSTTTTPPPTGSAFTITGVTPGTFDPSTGATTTIAYTVPTTCDYRLYVTNSAGTEVTGIVRMTNQTAGAKTRVWNGKNAATGAVLPNGTYTIVVEGINSYTNLTAAKANVTIGSTTSTPTGAFKITGITPATFDASKGQTTSIAYSVPVTCDYRVAVTNATGTLVKELTRQTAAAAGAKTVAWDGKNTAGTVAADGTYTVTVEGLNGYTGLTAAKGTVAVATTTTPPPPPPTGTELGQTIEGAGSANFAWLQYPGRKLGVAFKSPRTGSITQITLQWKRASSGYGAGTYGKYDFELQTNGTGNFPSGTVIASTRNVNPITAMDGYGDGAFHFPISANLTAGTIYHLVVTNVDPNPSANWSSPNGMMTSVKPWDGTGNRAACYQNGAWSPWSSTNNPWNTAKSNSVNGEHIPTMLTWSDGVNTGDHYYSSRLSAGQQFYGSNKGGEYIVWDKPNATITKVGVNVRKNGNPTAPLIYHLEKIGSGDLATGTIATGAQLNTTYQTWVYATLPSAVTLQQGQTYRLWFESPSSTSSNNYFMSQVYGENRPASWLEAGWGGTKSYFTSSTGSSWTSMLNGDAVFSLQ